MTLDAKPNGHQIVRLTRSDFDAYINSGRPIFVDFWAVWCGPCKAMEPAIERLATKYAGKVIFGKLNVDENLSVATRYNIRGIPTLLLFKKGQIQEQVVGATSKDVISRLLDKHL